MAYLEQQSPAPQYTGTTVAPEPSRLTTVLNRLELISKRVSDDVRGLHSTADRMFGNRPPTKPEPPAGPNVQASQLAALGASLDDLELLCERLSDANQRLSQL